MVVLAGTAGWLGWWQVEAWQARRTAEARDLTMLDPVPMTEVIGSDDPFPAPDAGRPVTVAGEWLPEGSFWVSGREHGGRDGYWAVAPLAVGGAGEPAVLVVLGWSADTDLPPPTGEGRVTGWLQPPEGGLVTDDDPSDDVFPELRVADAVQRVDTDLWSAYVVLDHDRTDAVPPAGLEPADLDTLPEVGRFTAVRNLLYGVEWWIFGGFAAFVWWRWLRDARDSERAAIDAAEEESHVAG
jgi:surfeit locus 1 family protein